MLITNRRKMNGGQIMATYRVFIRTSTLRHRVEVTCRIPLPDLDVDPTQAPAMGKELSEQKENIERCAEELLFPQYFHAMRRHIERYDCSQLPTRLLDGQQVIILPLSYQMLGGYNILNKVIYLDCNSVCGIGEISGDNLFGHELGHKAMDVKSGAEWLLKEVASILGVGYWENCQKLKELVADETGNLVSGETEDREIFNAPIDYWKRKEIQKRVLQFIWR